jgi:hypothetical protein
MVTLYSRSFCKFNYIDITTEIIFEIFVRMYYYICLPKDIKDIFNINANTKNKKTYDFINFSQCL